LDQVCALKNLVPVLEMYNGRYSILEIKIAGSELPANVF
jgi:hypothetical protein